MARADLARDFQRAVAGAAFVAIAVLPTSPAVAQTQRQLDWCLNKNESFSPRLRIDGCTAAIQSNRQSGKNLYSVFYNRGIAYFRQGQYDRAIADFDQALNLDPSSTFALNNRGTAYARKGQYDRAIEDFDQAIGLNPNYAITYNNRGSAYAKNGKYDYAIVDFEQALQLDPKDVSARKNRELAEQLMGNTARADTNVPSAVKNRSVVEPIKSNPPETAKNDTNANSNREPPNQLKDNATGADRKVASASRTRGSGALKSKSKGPASAARPRRSKPQSALARFFRQQQLNIRKMIRMVARR